MTDNPKQSSKSELIRSFARSMDKNCQNAEDVTSVINAINEFAAFMDKQKRHKLDFILDIRAMKEFIHEESGSSKMLDNLHIISDEFIGAMMIADRYKKETDMLFEILNEPALVI